MLLELCVPFGAASQVLKKHEDEFFDAVIPKLNLLLLKRKEVISEGLIAEIKAADTRDAKEILFEHLHCNADVAALMEYCKMAIAADGFPRMQKLGEKMLNELALEGLLEQCILSAVCMCVHLQVYRLKLIIMYPVIKRKEDMCIIHTVCLYCRGSLLCFVNN